MCEVCGKHSWFWDKKSVIKHKDSKLVYIGDGSRTTFVKKLCTECKNKSDRLANHWREASRRKKEQALARAKIYYEQWLETAPQFNNPLGDSKVVHHWPNYFDFTLDAKQLFQILSKESMLEELSYAAITNSGQNTGERFPEFKMDNEYKPDHPPSKFENILDIRTIDRKPLEDHCVRVLSGSIYRYYDGKIIIDWQEVEHKDITIR